MISPGPAARIGRELRTEVRGSVTRGLCFFHAARLTIIRTSSRPNFKPCCGQPRPLSQAVREPGQLSRRPSFFSYGAG
jgi:hypothetical protein